MSWRVPAGIFTGTAAIIAAVLTFPSPAYSHKPITTNILFKNEVAQIFQRKCLQCHSDSNLSMSLTNYTAARPWARAIREEILERSMPPWPAVRGYGHFANDLSLTQREIDIIVSWADGGAPSGVLKVEEGIVPVYVKPGPEWDYGAPDLVVPIGAQKIDAGAPHAVQRIVVATNLPAARRVRGIALKQGDRRVVRHAAFYEEGTGRWLGGWTPWQTMMGLPDGVSYRMPARARVVVEIGYGGGDETVTDNSELGLYFDSSAESVDPKHTLISAAETSVPAGAAAHRIVAETRVAAASAAFALWPDPGVGARSIEVNAITPEGVVTPLLWVKDYRPDWQTPYVLANPVALPRGTRLKMTVYADNSGDQPVKIKPTVSILTMNGATTSR